MQQVQGRSVAVEPPRFRAAPAAYADLLVLAGSVGVADTWTSGLPRALLPLPGGTVLGDVIVKTSSLTGGSCIVCVNSKRNLYEDWIRRSGEFAGSVRIAADRLPRGTAGCIKDCQPHLTGAPLLIVGGSVWLEDDPEWLLEQHRSQGNALTVFCIPHQVWTDDSPGRRLRPAGLFCCEPEVLQYIPETGYHDLKEQLGPALQRA
ncbi:MAG: hypothetical protein HY763_14575, partial [Planctomycetes bacterium]|nr:hypothetical protein [Planctomycetota bacterium]